MQVSPDLRIILAPAIAPGMLPPSRQQAAPMAVLAERFPFSVSDQLWIDPRYMRRAVYYPSDEPPGPSSSMRKITSST